MAKALSPINAAVQDTFSVIFSTPLAGFFLSLFSYFTLSSLYILLNVDIPEKVSEYLEKLYESCNADILTQVGVGNLVGIYSNEKVNEEKPIRLGISSDLVS